MKKKSLIAVVLCAVGVANVAAENQVCQRPESRRTLLRWARRPEADGDEKKEGGGELELSLDEETMKAISAIDGETAVISVVGPHGTGKSYYFNQLAHELMTTTTTEAATKDNHDSNGKDKSMEPLFRVVDGLVSDSDGDGDDGGVNDADALLSVVILPGCLNVLPENPGTAVLLVDSPALHSDPVGEAAVLTILNAMSSVVLYNTVQRNTRIDAEALENAIHAVRALETLRHAAGDLPDKGSDAVDTVVDGNAKGEEDTGNKGDKNGADTKAAVGGDAILSTNPKLLWLVQQCPPKMVEATKDSQEKRTALIGQLLRKGGSDDDLATRQKVLDRFFAGETDAAFLPLPLKEADRLSDLKSVSFSELGEDYRTGVTKTMELIRKMCNEPRQLYGKPVTGTWLGETLLAWMKILKDDSVKGKGPTALLDGLEKKEIDVLVQTYKTVVNHDNVELPVETEVELKGIHDEGVTRVQADSKRDYGNAADVGASEQLLVGESDRRPAFVAKVKRLLENRYEALCFDNSDQSSVKELKFVKEALKELVHKEKELARKNKNPEESKDEDEEDPRLGYSKFLDFHNDNQSRWRKSLIQTVPDLCEGVRDKVNQEHLHKLQEVKKEFLEDNLRESTKQAQKLFDGELAKILDNLDVTKPAEDFERASKKAHTVAQTAFDIVATAVEKCNIMAESFRQDLETKAEQRIEKEKNGKADGTDEKGALEPDTKGKEDEGGDEKNEGAKGQDPEPMDNNQKGGSFLECLAKIEPAVGDNSLDYEDEVKSCIKEEEKGDGDTDAPRMSSEELNERERSYKATVNRMREAWKSVEDILKKYQNGVDIDKDVTEKLKEFDNAHTDVAFEKLKKLLRGHVEEEVDKVKKNGERNRECEKQALEYKDKATKAASLFSLAPLRYSGVPPFDDKDNCLSNEGVLATVTDAQSNYLKNTRTKRWVTMLILWCGVVQTLMAGVLLWTGRRLQSRVVAVGFVASALFHLVVLCLAVPEGLLFGFRLWLLLSVGLLLAALRGMKGAWGKRGRGSRRGVWSVEAAGRKGLNPSGGILPLFAGSQGSKGGYSGGGSNAAPKGSRHSD